MSEAKKTNPIATFALPFGMMYLLFIALMSSAPQLLTAVIEEKMSQISEVLISSVTPFQLLMGKLLGVAGVAALLAFVYLGGGVYALMQAGQYELIQPRAASPGSSCFCSCAVLMFGSVFIAIGAACSDLKDAQSMLQPFMMLLLLPMFASPIVLRQPNSIGVGCGIVVSDGVAVPDADPPGDVAAAAGVAGGAVGGDHSGHYGALRLGRGADFPRRPADARQAAKSARIAEVDSSVDADVIVAGAGPAGAVAARTLAQSGLRTLLVDRAGFPRNKPCGGGISTRALRRFPWLDARLTEIDVHRISKLHLEGPHGTAVDIATADPSVLLLRRLDFDHALVREAVGAGARLVERFEVTQVAADDHSVTFTSRDGRTLRAPAVVAADGVHSVMAKRLGVNARWPETRLAIDMMEETPLETLSAERPDVLWVAYAYQDLDGYAYIFPKTHHVNVGIGCLLSHFKREVDAAPYELQQQFVRRWSSAGELHGRSDRRQFTPFLIPIGGPLPQRDHGRVLFAGDAGGFVNAITAEGIYYAMVSGELAGRALTAVRGDGVAAGRRLRSSVAARAWHRARRRRADSAVSVFESRARRASRARRGRRAGPGRSRAATTCPGICRTPCCVARCSCAFRERFCGWPGSDLARGWRGPADRSRYATSQHRARPSRSWRRPPRPLARGRRTRSPTR